MRMWPSWRYLAAKHFSQALDTRGCVIHTFICLQLCALYAVTDVALVTSLRDGMNLVSYEYVACQSENAGAAEN
jgi:Glycosyltransferase family 20